MREIKFKAWDKEVRVWLDNDFELTGIWDKAPGSFRRSLTIEELNKIFAGMKKGTEDVVYCQYTGLKDRNGVEIYEGDILIDDEYPDEGISYAKVVWYENGFVADPWFGVEELTKEAGNYEVIGNIYENQDLISKK